VRAIVYFDKISVNTYITS